MFERATKLKLRYPTKSGNVTTEDLWDLPLTSGNGSSLDDIAKTLNRQVKDSEEESFVVKRSGASETLVLKLDIVKHIIGVKLDEIEASEQRVNNKAKKEKILAALEEKENESLKGKSKTKLREMLEDLG